MPRKIVATLLFFLIAFAVSAQQPTKDELEKQREQLKKEIQETEKALIETQKTTKVNVGQLTLINKKLDLQDNVVHNISNEIRKLSDNIYLSQLEINKIQRILDTLKVEYAKSMVYAYKNRSNYDFLNFIFSANNFNDAIKRIAYLKSYRNYREMQAENILKTQALLEDKIKRLSGLKDDKKDVLSEKDKELEKLQKQKEQKADIVSKLKGRQKELLTQVRAKRKQDAKLKNAITAMIRREIAKAKAEAERRERERLAAAKNNTNVTKADKSTNVASAKTTSIPSGSVLVSSEADKALNASFEKNKGILPWPVDGYIIYHNGINKFPGGVDYYEQGVNIGTKIGQTVKAVFDGEVTLVSYVEDQQAVYIRHGEYFTIYSNLSSVAVQKGQKVSTGQTVGKAGVNDDGQGDLEFIMMKEMNFINPEPWLKR